MNSCNNPCNNPNYQSRNARDSINRSVYEACQCATEACECRDVAVQAQISAEAAETSANSSANQSQAIWNDFQQRYMGPYPSPPVTTSVGALYWNSSSNALFVWNGTSWVAAPSGFNEFTTFLATGTTTARNLVTRFADVVNVKDFGAVGDGVTDNTAAIQTAYASLPANKTLYFPAGVYRYNSQLVFSGNKRPSFIGDGPTQSILLYGGAANNVDCIQVGNGTNEEGNWYISGMGFRTGVNTISGAGIRFRKLVRSLLENVTFGDQDFATTRAHIGVWFDQVDMVSVNGFQAMGSQEALRVNGSVGAGPKADFFINNGKIGRCQIGIHIGGGFGGFYLDSVDVIASTTNILIDRTVANEQNREIFFGPGALIDGAGTASGVFDGINVDVQDTGGYISFDGTWCASAGTLMRVGPNFTGEIIVDGGVWFNAFNTFGGPGDAFLISNSNSRITAKNVYFNNIQGFVASNTAGTPSQDIRFIDSFLLGGNIPTKLNNIGRVNRNVYENLNQIIDGKLITLHSAPIQVATEASPPVTLALGPSTVGGTIAIPYYRNLPASGFIELAKSRSDTIGTHSIVQAGDSLGGINFSGSDGSAFVSGARVAAQQSGGTPASGDIPAKLVFFTRDAAQPSIGSRLEITSTGNTVPSTDNVYTCGQNGNKWSAIWATNGTIQTSDERDKKDVQQTPLGLDFINSLNPVCYKWKVGGNKVTEWDEDGNPKEIEKLEGHRTHHGLLAQEVKAALPEGVDFGGWVLTDKDNPNSQQALRYDQFIAPLIKAIQEQQKQIEELTAKVVALESK